MLRGLIITIFVSFVALSIVSALILLRFFRRGGKAKTASVDLVNMALFGNLTRSYNELLREARLKSTCLDKVLHLTEQILKWVIVGSAILCIVLLLVNS
jgi:hypothetical protein